MDNPISDALARLQPAANKAMEPEIKEPGPGDVGPSTENKSGGALVSLPMSEAEVTEWWKRIERATTRVDRMAEKWDILLDEYRPHVEKSGAAEAVKVQMHFRNVHSKIGQLFYRAPDLILTAKDPGPASNEMPNPMMMLMPPGMPPLPPLTMEDIISVKQQVLQTKLGRDGLKVGRLMDELLFDVLAWSGVAASKLGYRCVIKNIQQPKMQPAPPVMGLGGGMPPMGAPSSPPGPPSPLGPPAQPMMQMMPEGPMGSIPGGAPPPPPMVPVLDALGQPVMETIPVPIFEDYYWRRFSPKKLLWNDDLKSTRVDEDATWVGMHFYMSQKRAMKELGLTEEEAKAASSDDRVHSYVDDPANADKAPGLVHGVELFCKASAFTDELHPQAINQLILIDSIRTKPIVWRPSQDQEFDGQGKLTPNSLVGFPIRVLAIRDLADSSFPESDSAFTNSEIKQLTTYRRQGVKLRDAAIGKYLYDQGCFDTADIQKLEDADVGTFVGVLEGKLEKGGDKVLTTTAQVRGTADDYRGEQLLKQDINETLGLSANSSGTQEQTIRSATETATVNQAMQARNEKELGRVTDFYLDGARMIDSLLMRYATNDDYETITGEDGAKRMMMWNNKIISGRYIYDIAPDSQNRVDTTQDFMQTMSFYNLAAKDPLFNRPYVLRRLARMRGMDPAKVVLNPAMVMQQPPHGGPGDVVNEHQASNSGKRPNEPGAENKRKEQIK